MFRICICLRLQEESLVEATTRQVSRSTAGLIYPQTRDSPPSWLLRNKSRNKNNDSSILTSRKRRRKTSEKEKKENLREKEREESGLEGFYADIAKCCGEAKTELLIPSGALFRGPDITGVNTSTIPGKPLASAILEHNLPFRSPQKKGPVLLRLIVAAVQRVFQIKTI